jgi:hypothetical protein
MKRRDLLKTLCVAPMTAAIPFLGKKPAAASKHLDKPAYGFSSGVVVESVSHGGRRGGRAIFVADDGPKLKIALDLRPDDDRRLLVGDIVTIWGEGRDWTVEAYTRSNCWAEYGVPDAWVSQRIRKHRPGLWTHHDEAIKTWYGSKLQQEVMGQFGVRG